MAQRLTPRYTELPPAEPVEVGVTTARAATTKGRMGHPIITAACWQLIATVSSRQQRHRLHDHSSRIQL